ncbi:hypothetical protein LCGC14_2734600 [marine sediment metagenome]|uniref:Uncharacterized protein n=1 Tax=marine sediment metagenome TaxID=412755 RepID=A0A0F9BF56_9ZZZZ
MKTLTTLLILFACITSQAQDYERLFTGADVTFDSLSLSAFMVPTGTFELSYEHENYYHVPFTWWDKWGHSTAITLWQIGATSLNAWGDGLNHNGNKDWGHFCNATSYAMYMSGPFVLNIDRRDWFPYLVGCVLVRFEFFDPVHNATIGMPLSYVGSVSNYDKAIRAFNAPPHGWWFARGISLTLHIGINYKTW